MEDLDRALCVPAPFGPWPVSNHSAYSLSRGRLKANTGGDHSPITMLERDPCIGEELRKGGAYLRRGERLQLVLSAPLTILIVDLQEIGSLLAGAGAELFYREFGGVFLVALR